MTYFRLVFYELKKLFSFSSIKLIVALMLILNIAVSISYINLFNPNKTIREQENVYELYQTDIDFFYSQYELIIDNWYNHSSDERPVSNYGNGKVSDMRLFLETECFANADADYHEQIDALLAKTKVIQQSLIQDSYNYRYQGAIIEKYETLNETVKLKNEPVYGWKYYFGYDSEVIFVLIAVFACTVMIGLDDKTTGFISICSASPRGGRSTVAAKFTAVVIVSFVLAILFAVSSLVTIGSIYGLSDAGNAIQSVFDSVSAGSTGYGDKVFLNVIKRDLMVLCPLSLSIAEFLVVFFLQKAMAAIVCAVVILTASVLWKRYWVSGLAGGIFVILQYQMSTLDVIAIEQWKYLNVFSVYSATEFLVRFRCVNIFGYPVDLIGVFCVLFLLILVIAFLICMLFYKQRKVIHSNVVKSAFNIYDISFVQKLMKKMRTKKYKGSFSMLNYELFKNKFVFLLLAILLIGKCVMSSDTYAWKDTSYNRLYTQYISEIGGEYSAEKAEYIANEYALQAQIESQNEEMENNYINGNITKEEYAEYLQKYYSAKEKLSVLMELTRQSSYLERLYAEKGILGSYIFSDGFEKYMDQDADWLLLVFICVFCCNIFIVEFGKTSSKGTVISLIQSTPRGRISLYKAKLLLIGATVTVTYWAFFIIDYINLSSNWVLPKSTDLLISLRSLKQAPNSLTFGEYFVLIAVLGFLGALLISFLCISISQMLNETVFVYAICAAVLVIPHFAETVGITVCGYFNFTNLINTNRLFTMSNTLQFIGSFGWFAVFFVLCIILVGILAMISVKQIRKGLKG